MARIRTTNLLFAIDSKEGNNFHLTAKAPSGASYSHSHNFGTKQQAMAFMAKVMEATFISTEHWRFSYAAK